MKKKMIKSHEKVVEKNFQKYNIFFNVVLLDKLIYV